MTNCPRNIKHRLLATAADHAHTLLCGGDPSGAENILDAALHGDLEYARYYLESDVGANLANQNYWAIEEAESLGHRVIDVLPVEGEDWTATIKCQSSDNRQPYYIHLDDGWLHFSLCCHWHQATDSSGFFYTIQPYALVSGLPHFKGI